MSRLALTFFALLTACDAPRVAPPQNTAQQSDVSLQNVTLKSWRGDHLRVVATASRLELDRSSSRFAATTADARLLESGVALSAPHADGDQTARTVAATGGVALTGKDGLTGHTDAANFDGAQSTDGVATSSSPVEVKGPGLQLHANGFHFDVATQTCDFDGPVRSTVQPR